MPTLGAGLPATAYVRGGYALQCTLCSFSSRIFPSCLPDSLSCILDSPGPTPGPAENGAIPETYRLIYERPGDRQHVPTGTGV